MDDTAYINIPAKEEQADLLRDKLLAMEKSAWINLKNAFADLSASAENLTGDTGRVTTLGVLDFSNLSDSDH